jgi:GAF domain-containing protein
VDARPSLTPAVAAIRALYDAAACSVALVGEDGATLTYVTSDGAGAEEIVGVELPVSRGIAGWTVMSGQPIAVRDVETDARFARDVAESTHYVPTSILAAPLFDDEGEAAGVLSVLDPRVDQSADWTLTVLGTLAALVGLLVEGGEGDAGDGRLAALGRRVLAAVEELGP